MDVIRILLIYLACINAFGFLLMGIDKRKAKKNMWRIPEATLFVVALIGGSIGSIIGMYTFRHKTKHLTFVIGMPAILAIQVLVVILLLFLSPLEITIM